MGAAKLHDLAIRVNSTYNILCIFVPVAVGNGELQQRETFPTPVTPLDAGRDAQSVHGRSERVSSTNLPTGHGVSAH